jgi:hypothetical protein
LRNTKNLSCPELNNTLQWIQLSAGNQQQTVLVLHQFFLSINLSGFLQEKNAKDHDALPATYLFHLSLLNIIN